MLNHMRMQGSKGAPPPSGERRARREIVVLSLLLHLLFLAVWDSALRLDLAGPPAAVPAPPRGAPLVFDLQSPATPREVIATPDDARTTTAPRRADFLSDKNALARDQEPAPALPVTGDPFSRGDLASHEIPPQPAAPGSAAAVPAGAEANRENEPAAREAAPPSAPATPPAREAARPGSGRQRFDLPAVPHRQLEGRAAEAGGLSFNTYNWNFAPYMLALKERIGRNIFPPLAFSKFGVIDGDTMLRFKIFPDGRLADLQLLGYSGHHSLMQTSRFAVTASAPFPSLPQDFPEPYLEVTAKFIYFIRK